MITDITYGTIQRLVQFKTKTYIVDKTKRTQREQTSLAKYETVVMAASNIAYNQIIFNPVPI